MLLLALFVLLAAGNCAAYHRNRYCPARCRKTCANPEPRNCEAYSNLPTCSCEEGYIYASTTGKCIPVDECPPDLRPCPARCKKTCTNPLPKNCGSYSNRLACSCEQGYVYASTTGNCIPLYECPPNRGCGGDRNAIITEFPSPCPSTCKHPGRNYCEKPSTPLGCRCKPGYILSKISGKCILPENCPGGYPCKGNTTFLDCVVNCPSDDCPVDDSNAMVACSIAYPCPSGCGCKYGQRRVSSTDRRCILPEDCPEVECTRPNEEWDPCFNVCYSESCNDINRPIICYPFIKPPCRPQCACVAGYARDVNGLCILKEDCPPVCNGENEEINPCPSPCYTDSCNDVPYRTAPCNTLLPVECVPTCQCKPNYAREDNGICIPVSQCPPKACPPRCKPTCTRPNPSNCSPNPACQTCQSGYILPNRKNSTCIPIYQCPQEDGCNGDKNAVIQERVISCRSTCEQPSQSGCNEAFGGVVGCICKGGYILSTKYGKCIPIETCPGGNPCGQNQTFTSCTQCRFDACPTNEWRRYGCDPTWPCPAGCICADGYNRLNGQCVLSSECPPVKPDLELGPVLLN